MAGSIRVLVQFRIAASEMNDLCGAVRAFFDGVVSKRDGFLEANFHQNEDKTLFVNYASWESLEAYQSFLASDVANSSLAMQVIKYKPESIILTPIEL